MVVTLVDEEKLTWFDFFSKKELTWCVSSELNDDDILVSVVGVVHLSDRDCWEITLRKREGLALYRLLYDVTRYAPVERVNDGSFLLHSSAMPLQMSRGLERMVVETVNRIIS